MKQFTIKNLIIFWLQSWPLNLIITLVGILVGVCLVIFTPQSYSNAATILIINQSEVAKAADYSGIINSPYVIERSLEKLDISDSDCQAKAVGTDGNMVNIHITCLTTPEDVDSLMTEIIENTQETFQDFYDDSLEVALLTNLEEAAADVTTLDRISRVAIFGILGVLISMVVAFVRFDFITSKRLKQE